MIKFFPSFPRKLRIHELLRTFYIFLRKSSMASTAWGRWSKSSIWSKISVLSVPVKRPHCTWGDENVPYYAVKHLPVFVPRKLSWSLVRERRVGGLKPWRSGLVQSLFTPVSFEFIRSPTHHFPCRRSAIRSKKRRIGAEDGGLGSVQDCRAIYFKRS